jgi:hypothetical protein
VARKTFKAIDVLAIASNLASENGENTEYDRALVDMTCDLLGLPQSDAEIVELFVLHDKKEGQ